MANTIIKAENIQKKGITNILRSTYMLLLIGCTLFMMVFLLINTQFSIISVKKSLDMFFENILPSLLPIIFVSKCLTVLVSNYFTKNKRLSAFYLYFTSIIAGYPIGAKTLAELYQNGIISSSNTNFYAKFTNNSGPMFVVGVIGIGFCQSAKVGWILYFIHILSSLINLLIAYIIKQGNRNASKQYNEIGHYGRNEALNNQLNNQSNSANIGQIMLDSIKSALLIGGFISVVAILTDCIPLLRLPNNIKYLLYILIEMTNGAKVLSTSLSLTASLPLLSATIGFGGLCVFFQSIVFYTNCQVKLFTVLKYKIIQAVSSYLICLLLVNFFVFT